MISIGGYYNGPELSNSRVASVLQITMKALAVIRGPWIGNDDFGPCDEKPVSGSFFERGSKPAINVVFYVPGSMGQNAPEKIEVGRFSRKHKLLLVAVPVPPEMVESDAAAGFVIEALHKANQIAFETFKRKGPEPFDLEGAEAIVEKVRKALITEYRELNGESI